MKEISRVWEMVKGASTYGIIGKVIREIQNDFQWINHNMVDYFIKVSKVNKSAKQLSTTTSNQHYYQNGRALSSQLSEVTGVLWVM